MPSSTTISGIHCSGIEINKTAAAELGKLIGHDAVFNGAISADFEPNKQANLALIKGVLIHINPQQLDVVYEKLYETSSRYILVAEYNPSPVSISCRATLISCSNATLRVRCSIFIKPRLS